MSLWQALTAAAAAASGAVDAGALVGGGTGTAVFVFVVVVHDSVRLSVCVSVAAFLCVYSTTCVHVICFCLVQVTRNAFLLLFETGDSWNTSVDKFMYHPDIDPDK